MLAYVPEPQQQPIANAIKKIMDIIFCIFEKLGIDMLGMITGFLKNLIGKTIAAPLCAAEQPTPNGRHFDEDTSNGLLEPIMDGISWLTGALSSVSSAFVIYIFVHESVIEFPDCDSLSCKKVTDWTSSWGLHTTSHRILLVCLIRCLSWMDLSLMEIQ